MMASVILVVGFMGMISSIAVGSEMLATARRQELASQIINHEFEKLRLTTWSTINAPLSTYTATDYTALTPDDTQFDAPISGSGATFLIARTVTSMSADLYEVTLTVTWSKSGTSTATTIPSGSWLSQLTYSRNSPVSRTYTRTGTTYFGKYGLNNSIQRL
jgi:Tfp pilus assembly protein PilV